MKRLLSILCSVLLCTFLLGTGALATEAIPEITLKKADTDTAWDAQAATFVNFDTGSITGSGAQLLSGILTITAPGEYVLSGTLKSGQVIVDVTKDDKVQLILNGVHITSADGPAVWIKSADKVTITLADNTQNTLADSATYTLPEGSDEPNACLYSKDDLTINGSGTLTVTASYLHGILTKDDLKIISGNINVTAVGHGIRGRDSVSITGGNLNITSGQDGIQSNNAEEEGCGFIVITGGEFAITAQQDGIQAETGLYISGGIFNIKTGSGAVTTKTGDQGGWGRSFGGSASTTTNTISQKGLKCDKNIVITGGTFNITAQDDAVHSNSDITINDGTFTLATGDDGIHADGNVLITGGTITVTQSYEGIEGAVITITGGDISVTASDDGLNAAGGEQAVTTGGGWGRGGGMMDSNANNILRITGGTLYVNAGGDGLDSNGYIYIEGGVICIDGPTDNGNGALDSGVDIIVSGGLLVAAGSSGMAETPGNSSTQYSIMAYTGSQSGGTTITVTDASGNQLVSYTPSKTYQCAVISCPQFVKGSSYTVSVNGSQLATVTLSSIVTATQNSGNNRTNNNGMKGPGR